MKAVLKVVLMADCLAEMKVSQMADKWERLMVVPKAV